MSPTNPVPSLSKTARLVMALEKCANPVVSAIGLSIAVAFYILGAFLLVMDWKGGCLGTACGATSFLAIGLAARYGYRAKEKLRLERARNRAPPAATSRSRGRCPASARAGRRRRRRRGNGSAGRS